MRKKSSPLANLDTADIRLLKVFDSVVRNKGFSAAQMELNINQSSISSQMANLEVRLGLHLCHRGRGGFKLTEDGEKVFTATQALFNAIDVFKADVGILRGHLVGEINVGMVDAVLTNPEFKLSSVISSFREQAPEVKLHLNKGAPNDLIRGIQEDVFHFAITSLPKAPDGLTCIPLFKETQVLYCARGHALFDTNDNDISMKTLENTPFASRSLVHDGHDGGTCHFSSFNSLSASADMECIATLILSGKYIGYLPDHYAQYWVSQCQMRPILEHRLCYHSDFSLVLKNNKLSPSANLFLALLKEQYAE